MFILASFIAFSTALFFGWGVWFESVDLIISIIVFGVISLLYGKKIQSISRKDKYQLNMLLEERWIYYSYLISIVLFLFFGLLIIVLSFVFPIIEIEVKAGRWAIHFGPELMLPIGIPFALSFPFLLSMSILVLRPFPIGSYTKTKMCLKVTLDTMTEITKQETSKRSKNIRKKFIWFKEALKNYNSFLTENYRSIIRDIDNLYNIAYILALEGDSKQIKNLTKYLKKAYDSLGKEVKDNDLRGFLRAIQGIQGGKERTLINLSRVHLIPSPSQWKRRITTMIEYGTPIISVLVLLIEYSRNA